VEKVSLQMALANADMQGVPDQWAEYIKGKHETQIIVYIAE